MRCHSRAFWPPNAASFCSFVSQSDQGIDAGGAARGDVASQQSRGQQYGRNRAKCREVDYCDIVKQAVHRAANQIRTAEAEGQAYKSQGRAFLQNEAEHAALAGAERHAQSDFVRSLCHRKRHHAINAQRCEQECHAGEPSKKKSCEAIPSHGFVLDLIHRLDLGERQIGIHGQDDIRNAFAQVGWIDGCAHRYAGVWPGALPEWHVNLGEALSLWTAVVDVIVDTDDLPFNRRTELGYARDQLLNEDALLQRIDAGKIALRKYLVHHSDAKTARQILIGEVTSLVYMDPKGLEELWRYHIESGARTLGGIVSCFTDNLKWHAEIGASERHAGGYGGRGHAGESSDSVKKLPIEGVNLF